MSMVGIGPGVKLTMDYTAATPDPDYVIALNSGEVIEARLLEVAGIPEGMQSGKPSVGFIVQLPDGKYVWSEISLAMFQTINRAFQARYGTLA